VWHFACKLSIIECNDKTFNHFLTWYGSIYKKASIEVFIYLKLKSYLNVENISIFVSGFLIIILQQKKYRSEFFNYIYTVRYINTI